MKLLARTALVLFICSVLLAAIGIAKYPYAPIRPTGSGYFDKKNNAHSVDEYRNYKIWENSLLVVGLLTSVTTFGYHIVRKLKKSPN